MSQSEISTSFAQSADADEWMALRIERIHQAACDIHTFQLARADGGPLPQFSAGSHVKVRVPNGLIRNYSLCNAPSDRHRYVIAVKRDAAGRGGSISLIDQAREGDQLPTSPPDNAFALSPGASSYLFIAGGIGITPIISMIRSIEESSQKPWRLCYLTRSPEATAFADVLGDESMRSRVLIHHDYMDRARALDLWPVLERPRSAHLYCCGPPALMESVRDMTGHWPRSSIHFESFNVGGGIRPNDRAFSVKLARSGETLEVGIGQSILTRLREAGYVLPSSCESGTCGTCRTRLVGGEPDHRDMVLMPEEQSTQIMVCVSRAKSDELILDL